MELDLERTEERAESAELYVEWFEQFWTRFKG